MDVTCLSTNALCEEKLIQFNASFSPKGSLSFFKHKKGDSDSLIEVLHISVAITVQVTL